MPATPVTPVPAATIILVRDADPSPEVLLLERHAKSDFLPDLYVFPGGRVDSGDHELADRIGGIDAALAGRLAPSVAPDAALAFFVAAIRETFEEAGVLLARPRGQAELVTGDVVRELSRHRLGVQEGAKSFRDLIVGADLELAADRLSVHGHWITPEMVPKRFDTLFFAAVAPTDHLASHDGVESTDSVWIRPEEAIEQGRRGERQLIFPTVANLGTISGFEDARAIVRASHSRPVVPVLPRVVKDGEQRRLVIPPEAGYSLSEAELKLPAP